MASARQGEAMTDHESKGGHGLGAKVCNRCARAMSLDAFYVYKTGPSAGKPHAACKECQKRRALAWKYANYEKDLARRAALRKRPGQAEKNLAGQRRYRERHPEKAKAREALNNAIKRGEIARQPCHKCGTPDAHGHHHDYSKPFDVEWLCHRCHSDEHRTSPEGIAALAGKS